MRREPSLPEEVEGDGEAAVLLVEALRHRRGHFPDVWFRQTGLAK
jgi:hypothetical protein